MPDPYADRWKDRLPSLASMRPRKETQQDKRNDDNADLLRFLGDIAPVAGGVLGTAAGGIAGGIAGAPLGPGAAATAAGGALLGGSLGSSLGGGLGQMAGQALHSTAEQQVADREDEELELQERRRAIFEAISGMAR